MVYFSGLTILNDNSIVITEGSIYRNISRIDNPSGRLFKQDKIIWAIGYFKPFKAPGRDSVFPDLTQSDLAHIFPFGIHSTDLPGGKCGVYP